MEMSCLSLLQSDAGGYNRSVTVVPNVVIKGRKWDELGKNGFRIE